MVSQRQNVERGKGGKWISSKSYPRSRGVWPWKWCLLRMSAHSPTSPHGETGLLFTNWKKSLVFLVEGLGFDIRFWLWHHFKTSSESNPSSLDRESLLPNSKFPKPKMMSCSFERFQFLEYYQEKKVIFLEFSPLSRCPEKKAVFSEQPGLHCSQAELSFWLHMSYTFIHRGSTNSNPERFLITISSAGHRNAKIISS